MPFCLGKYKMTTTVVYNPTSLSNVSIPNTITNINSIDWRFNPNALVPDVYASSQKPLYTISGIWMEKYLSNTSQLWCTGYKIPDTGRTVIGIELILDVKRASRIEDLVIQLTKDGATLTGDNYASTINPIQADMYTGNLTETPVPFNDYHIYGSSSDLWGTTWSSTDIANSTFGVVLSFRSNQIIPHSDFAYIHQAGVRITYA